MEVLIQCEGYPSDALMGALAPFVEGNAALELRPRSQPMRSAAVDPTVLVAIVQAGTAAVTTLILKLIEWRRSPDRALKSEDRAPGRVIRIHGADGVTIEIPLGADERTLASLVEEARRIENPRIDLS